MSIELKERKCLCGKEGDSLLYPEKIDWARFSADEFSARRDRRTTHYRIVRCNNCALVRSSPIFSDDDLNMFYKKCGFISMKESASAARTYALLLLGYLELLADVKSARLLEVGCGDGAFLKEIQKHGIREVSGVEPTEDALGHASPAIRSVIINDIFKPGLFRPESFDIICAFHVLDHLSDPDVFLKEAYRVIKTGGMIFLVCHNVDAVVNRVFGERSPVFDIEHIFLFNKSSLRNLAEKCGFESVNIGDIRNRYRVSYWLKYAPLLNGATRFLPRFIKDIQVPLKAGNIFICARKK